MNQKLNDIIKERLYDRYIAPTEHKKAIYSGVEIELPIVNLCRQAVDFAVAHKLARRFGKHFNFIVESHDDDGNLLALADTATNDIFTFDCSYNTLEISFGMVDDLREVARRSGAYLEFIQNFLQKHDHLAVGMGINPHRAFNTHLPIQTGRYRMLFHHLLTYKGFVAQKLFHPYPAYGMFSAASQVQLDILPGKLIQSLRVFNALEPFKSVLLANSPLKPEGLLLARDRLWADGMQGFNPRNVGAHDPVPGSLDELLEYLLDASMYCNERDGKYYNFAPVPLREYFTKPSISAEYYADGSYHREKFVPALDDLTYFRTFKFEDPTFRGTLEFRSVCAQPLRDTMVVPAFHLGLINQLDELEELLGQDALYSHGLTAVELRNLLNRESWPAFIDRSALSQTLIRILSIAETSLKRRRKNEEQFLRPLFDRAEHLTSPAREYTRRLAAGERTEALIFDYATLAERSMVKA
ncbi:MAG: glutamate-cysteine ligase family protein [Actinomycetia bacterium]|nr:glutamate-cysteine ligase family protein [Actinomycetes bacterium]